MELRHFRYFQALAEAQSFSRAAERIGISQPGLSHQIRQLEEELSVRLFDRFGRTIRLTAAGRQFAEHAAEMLRVADRAASSMAEHRDGQTGALRIGAIQSFNAYLVPPVVALFRRAMPQVHLQIFEDNAAAIERRLVEGDLEIGIAFAPPADERIRADILFEEELCGVVDARRASRFPHAISLAEAATQPLALFDGGMFTRGILNAAFAAAEITIRPMLEANTGESLLRAIAGSDLFAILPERMLRGRPGLAKVRLVDPTPRRAAALLRRRGAWRPRAADEFVALFRKHHGL